MRLLAAAGAVFLCAAAAPAADLRSEIEAEWARHDESWMREIREPGLVRFGEAEIQWPGVAPDARTRVPLGSAPRLDGALDDPCWARAARIPAPSGSEPSFLLSHDGKRLFVGATLATDSEASYAGPQTALDAAGAIDGVKDGRYGFHAGYEPNPWWQVDLGAPARIAKIIVYNRLDYAPGLHNADNLIILTSDDGVSWTKRYDNKGVFFGGVGQGKPLSVDWTAAPLGARFMRIQIPSAAPIFFHLDEVEVYGADDPAKNIALRRLATQSSLSQWSRGWGGAGGLFSLGRKMVRLAADEGLAIRREGGRTTIEAAFDIAGLPGGFPPTFGAPRGEPIPIAQGSAWRLAWFEDPAPRFGRNRIRVALAAEGTIDPPVEVVVESVVFTPRRPETRTLFRESLTAAKEIAVDAVIAEEGPAAIILRGTQGGIAVRDGRCGFIEPVAGTLARAEALLHDFDRPAPPEFASLRDRARILATREVTDGPDPAARKALYREARWLARRIAFSNPALAFDRLIFIKRFTQEAYPDVCLNHMPWVSRPGGDVSILAMDSIEDAPRIRTLISGALGPGHVHGMDLWFDADRVVFGYAKAKRDTPPDGWLDRRTSYDLRRTEEPIHIFEIGIDGKGLRQVTGGPWSDLDPTYCPNGDIAFTSERCGYSLQCNEYDKDETSCNLYIVKPDGSGIRRLTVTKDGDYLPHVLDDGTIGYTRWEYQERGWAHIQSIWTVRPDGTGADAIFKQHMNEPWAIEEARSIPGSHRLVAVATGHHTLPVGPVIIVESAVGMNNSDGIAIVTPSIVPPEGGMSGHSVPEGGVRGKGGFFLSPWPLTEKHFLASRTYIKETDATGYALYLIDVHGTNELIYRDPAISCSYPIPLRPRPKPPILADQTDPTLDYAICSVSDVTRGVEGIARERVKYIRVARRLPWPYTIDGGGERYEPDVKGVMINWTPARILGTVPVEPDGSAHFRVPVDEAIYFQLLDENQMELRRMRSFISFQPGERRSCVGCHESRQEAPPGGTFPLALRREPSVPEPPSWGTRPLSFLRDVQPVFDRHCVRCHAGLKPEAGIDLSAGITVRANRAWDTIHDRKLIARSNVGDDARITQPLEFGSHRSKLVEVIRGEKHRERVTMSQDDFIRIVAWIDANGPYHDGFLHKRLPVPPYDLASDRALADGIASIHAKRCGACHEAAAVTRLDWIDLRSPRRSLFLAAPLAKDAAGLARCKQAVYADAGDADYRAVLERVEAAVERVWREPRRDLRALDRGEIGALEPSPTASSP